MRSILFGLFLSVFLPCCTYAYLPVTPDHTINLPTHNLLQNKFSSIKDLGTYVMGVTEDGFALYTIDDTDSVLVQTAKIFTPFRPVSVRRMENQLIFRDDSSALYFYEISHLPDVKYQGKLNLGLPFADYAIDGRYIYLSRWFNGISRYLIHSFSTVTFVDSSMKGILVTQLQRSDSCLYALDEYNGIMRYRVGDGTFGHFIDYLLIPERPHEFLLSDSGALIQTTKPNLYHGTFRKNQTGESKVLDSVLLSATNDLLLHTGDLLVLGSERSVSLVNLQSSAGGMELLRKYQFDDLQPNGDIVSLGAHQYLLLPGKTNGAMFFPLDTNGEPFSAINRPGIISGIQMHGHSLITAGTANPIDIYTVDSGRAPEFTSTILNTPSTVRAMDMQGDTLAVMYYPDSRLDLILHPTNPDSLRILTTSYSQAGQGVAIQLHSKLRDSIPAILVQRPNGLHMIPWPTGDSLLPNRQLWPFATPIVAFYTHDSLLLVATNKSNVQFYTIMPDFTLRYRGVQNLGKEARVFYRLNDQYVLFFCDNVISRCDVTNPSSPHVDSSLVLPINISAVDADNGVLYGIGMHGIGIFSLKSSMPLLLDEGGKAGTYISVRDRTIAASDGAAVYLYDIRDYSSDSLPLPPAPPVLPHTFTLRQNYPNPFNGKTRIVFEVPFTSHVQLEVYNLLGQRVAALLDGTRTAGTYETEWDGKTKNGEDVATGIYYYRLTTSTTTITRKMLLVK